MRLYNRILLPIKAQRRLEVTKYAPAVNVPVPQGANSIDVRIDPTFDTSIITDIAPTVLPSWNTTVAVIPIPPATDFRTGFRVLFGSAAPVGATISYSMRVRP